MTTDFVDYLYVCTYMISVATHISNTIYNVKCCSYWLL